ncbi:hypothetical protein DFJ73DRAFT_460389 [Zopfochytrium polystomum]|nr:hypothetical protein DFJ73DRAFT_460389 [Zopfochytrium polystomum]
MDSSKTSWPLWTTCFNSAQLWERASYAQLSGLRSSMRSPPSQFCFVCPPRGSKSKRLLMTLQAGRLLALLLRTCYNHALCLLALCWRPPLLWLRVFLWHAACWRALLGLARLAGTSNCRTDWPAATPVTALIQLTSEPDDFPAYEPPLSFDDLTDSEADVLQSVPG